MSSLLPSENVRLLRLLKKTAAVYLLLNSLEGAATETEIARLLEISRGTARCHLQSLLEVELVVRIPARNSAHLNEYGGYCLTPAGRQMLPMIVPQAAPYAAQTVGSSSLRPSAPLKIRPRKIYPM